MTRVLFALAILCFSAALAPAHLEQCHTDTECMALCPEDDAECDGGPAGCLPSDSNCIEGAR